MPWHAPWRPCTVPPEARDGGRRLAARLLRDGVTVRITVHGASMHPLLRDGDRVEIAPLDRPAVPGDLILGEDPRGGIRLHRVVRTAGPGRVQTRGDATWRMDPAMDAAAVLGRVCRRQRTGEGWRPVEPRLLGVARARLRCLESTLRHGALRLRARLTETRRPTA